jgi:cysteine desulfurase
MTAQLYFDYCATSPLHPAVLEAMQPALTSSFGNPSSMHSFGQQAREMVDRARTQISAGLCAQQDEIFFTSGATEANNLALFGVINALPPERQHLIVSRIEHHAVLHPAESLAQKGCKVTFLPVNDRGFVSPEDLESALRYQPGLVSIMMVNNEVGSLQKIHTFAKLAHQYDSLMHTDAVQALLCYALDVDALEVDLLSISGHKIYGPKGVGALYIRKGTPIEPIFLGGAQEGKRRPGTENVAGIVGLGAAMTLMSEDRPSRYRSLSLLRGLLVSGLRQFQPAVRLISPEVDVSPHIISVSFPNVDGELLLFELNQAGVAVSMGSACTSESIEPSHVLSSMNIPVEQIEGTIRISLGIHTTSSEIEMFLSLLHESVEKVRTLTS